MNKAHAWAVAGIADLFRTTHKVKTQQVAKIRGQRCGDIELAGYLANTTMYYYCGPAKEDAEWWFRRGLLTNQV